MDYTNRKVRKKQELGRACFSNIKLEMILSDEQSINLYQPGGALVEVVGNSQGQSGPREQQWCNRH
eukprot:15327688-Ditylum_brightwellii.AAC.1